jgi:multiple sugar transport system permease protein
LVFALLLNSQIRAREVLRVAFLLLMLSPVAVSWMVGKSMMMIRFGPLYPVGLRIGLGRAVVRQPRGWLLTIMVMDAWTFIPL